jgi:hypothetical protein
MKQSLDGLNGQNSRRTRSKDGVNIVSCPLCDQAALFFRLPQTSTKIPDRSSNAPHRESVCRLCLIRFRLFRIRDSIISAASRPGYFSRLILLNHHIRRWHGWCTCEGL